MSTTLSEYRHLLQAYLAPLRRRVAVMTVLLLSGIGLQLWTPQILRNFIDQAQAAAPTRALIPLAFAFLTLTLLTQIIRIGAAYVTQDVKWRATNALRGDLAAHCLSLDLRFHNAQTPGTMIERIDGDVNELSNFFSQFVVQIAGNALLLLGVLLLLFLEDWRIGLAYTIFTLVSMLILSQTVSIAVPLWKERRHVLSEMMGFLEERLAGTEDIRASGAVPYVLRGLHALVQRLYRASLKAFLIGELGWSISQALFGIGIALALGLGGWLFMNDAVTLGTVYLMFHYLSLLRRPIDELARQLRDLQSATAGIERVNELLHTRPQVQSPPLTEAQSLPPGPLSVAFDAVHFAYHEDPVLHEVSFKLAPGEVLGLLGRTGSGKTTLSRLLFRLYDPQAGQVRLGDVPLPQTDLTGLRQQVGIVTQDVQLFQASVRDNLTFFDAVADDARIRDILHQLGLTDWLERLPQGLDTRLQPGGLSAGEAQLLAFARVFLKNPGLVILDEASSRLDPATEQRIEQAIDKLLHHRTAIIIAHRLATVQRADKILILEQGQVQEFGDRVALAADPNSRFARLLQTGLTQVLR